MGREEVRGGACRPLHLQPIALFIYSSAFSMPSWPAQSTLRFSKCQEKAQYAAAHAAVVWSGALQNALNAPAPLATFSGASLSLGPKAITFLAMLPPVCRPCVVFFSGFCRSLSLDSCRGETGTAPSLFTSRVVSVMQQKVVAGSNIASIRPLILSLLSPNKVNPDNVRPRDSLPGRGQASRVTSLRSYDTVRWSSRGFHAKIPRPSICTLTVPSDMLPLT